MATVILDHTMVTHKKLPIGSLLSVPLTWITRARQRRELTSLLGQSEHILHDVGLQRDEITREGLKPFWRP